MWEDEQKRVLLFVFAAKWTVEEFQEVVQKSDALMDSVSYKVDIIIDLQNGRDLPSGFIGAIRRVGRTPHRNQGIMVLVGVNMFVRAFYDVFVRLYPTKNQEIMMRMAANYDEAHAIFARSAQSDPITFAN
jgi:hypothetical protein